MAASLTFSHLFSGGYAKIFYKQPFLVTVKKNIQRTGIWKLETDAFSGTDALFYKF